tara:strand:+ start:1788 stop:2528 length:741 start_codon:yes stop_codon:yes gene_type:complete
MYIFAVLILEVLLLSLWDSSHETREEPAKSESTYASYRPEFQEESFWERFSRDPIVSLTFMLVVFNAGLLFASIRTANAANVTAKAAVDSHKPWLFPELRKKEVVPNSNANGPQFRTQLTYVLVNFGGSSAFIEEFRDTTVVCRDDEFPTGNEFGEEPSEAISNRLVKSGEDSVEITTWSRLIPESQWLDYQEGRSGGVFVLIEVKYVDVFDGITTERFCMRVPPEIGIFQRIGKGRPNLHHRKRE